MSTRRKLLFLCQTLPYPPDGGVHIRTFNILRQLALSFEITALCFFRQRTRPTPEAVEAGVRGLSEYAAVAAFPIPQETKRVRFAMDHVRSLAARRPYTHFVYKSASFRSALKRRLDRGDVDLVHMDSLDLSCFLPELDGLPVICTHHNIESNLLRRRASTEPAPLRWYMRTQARLMEEEERELAPLMAANAVVSREDAQRLAAIAPSATIITVPNGVDTDFFRPMVPNQRGVVFVGGHSWYPNRDGMRYFAEEILPLIRRRDPSVSVTWVGRTPDAFRREYERTNGVSLTGFVDDVRPFVAAASCYVVPLRVGGGTRLKILDAWAMGKAVVSTSIGCEGLDARDGENILIRDEPTAFAKAVSRVLEDHELRQRLASNARETAERVYSWEKIGESMRRQYERVAVGDSPSSGLKQ